MTQQTADVARLMQALDGILPAHTFKTDPQSRQWTSAAGHFTVSVETRPSRREIVLYGAGWNVTVPGTRTGLNVLLVAMINAGAINQPALPVEIETQTLGGIRLRRDDSVEIAFTDAHAVRVAAALVERASRHAGCDR